VEIAAVVLGLAIAWALFVPVADWLAHHDVGSATGALHETALDNARGRLLALSAGVFAAGALVFTARNYLLSRQGQVTDRNTKAIEQLGSDKFDVRIGGIYALERIAHDSARDHQTVMEVLTAFIREHSREPWPPPDPGGQEQARSTRPDVQAAVTVVGRRDAKRDIQPIDLALADLPRANLARAILTEADLRSADLRGAFLAEAKLIHADLSGADLSGALLWEADLTNARLSHDPVKLTKAVLTGAILKGADLPGVELTGADLIGADLTGANLLLASVTGANLSGATLKDADLSGADFRGATLTDANLADARLGGAKFTGGATLTSANLAGANLRGADLTDANLGSANLTGADLIGANLGGAKLTDARWPEDAPVPEGWKRNTSSGRLERATIDSGPAEAS
jgi:uncharacterized protein YjbI with pentapeptide repeats